ncbi:MAG: hypothetical protein ABI650_10890, partial [Dokdonella sp.]
MNFAHLFLAAAAMSSVAAVSHAADPDEHYLGQLATCQQSWFEWKDDDARMKQYMNRFTARFVAIEDEPAYRPKAALLTLGFPVIKVYPQSVGMGIGFSLQLGGQPDAIRREVEQRTGHPLECSTEDGMTSCAAELGENKTLVLMS